MAHIGRDDAHIEGDVEMKLDETSFRPSSVISAPRPCISLSFNQVPA